MSVGWKQQIVNILPSQKFSFCGKHKYCQFLSVDGNIRKSVLGSEKVVFEDYIVSNETSIQFELRILDFFQDPHFFPKKWLINIYCTCQKYTSLRKYHSNTSFHQYSKKCKFGRLQKYPKLRNIEWFCSYFVICYTFHDYREWRIV